ncbi:MAG: hypothetical protein L6Q60_11790 [Rhodocyclaceae bacterium]|nr:hypothetical protein [Rhodocyclaceae bacterium]
MNKIGPPLEALLRRLADTPPDFLDEPRIGNTGQVFVPAVVNDLLAKIAQRLPQAGLEAFRGRDASTDRNRLLLVMIMVWLLADEWFADAQLPIAEVLGLLNQTARELALSTNAQKFIADPDRREELARLSLARLGFRPEGETPEQATDRLSALSVTERNRLLDASRAAEARAKAIREQLIKKQAEASADKWTRE